MDRIFQDFWGDGAAIVNATSNPDDPTSKETYKSQCSSHTEPEDDAKGTVAVEGSELPTRKRKRVERFDLLEYREFVCLCGTDFERKSNLTTHQRTCTATSNLPTQPSTLIGNALELIIDS